jgi:hypothetical protein
MTLNLELPQGADRNPIGRIVLKKSSMGAAGERGVEMP